MPRMPGPTGRESSGSMHNFETTPSTGAYRQRCEDRVKVIELGDGVVIVVADGAGGTGAGEQAAESVIREVTAAASLERDADSWCEVLRQTGCRVGAGESTCVVVARSPRGIVGASVGAGRGCWRITPKEPGPIRPHGFRLNRRSVGRPQGGAVSVPANSPAICERRASSPAGCGHFLLRSLNWMFLNVTSIDLNPECSCQAMMPSSGSTCRPLPFDAHAWSKSWSTVVSPFSLIVTCLPTHLM